MDSDSVIGFVSTGSFFVPVDLFGCLESVSMLRLREHQILVPVRVQDNYHIIVYMYYTPSFLYMEKKRVGG